MSNKYSSDKPIERKNFDVKVELLIPTTITYRVLALDEQDALKEIDKGSARRMSTHQNLNRKIKLKATVYGANTTMIKLSKTYRNI